MKCGQRISKNASPSVKCFLVRHNSQIFSVAYPVVLKRLVILKYHEFYGKKQRSLKCYILVPRVFVPYRRLVVCFPIAGQGERRPWVRGWKSYSCIL